MQYKSKVCCLIGDPIEHTISPLIHNIAFQKLGIDYVYVAFRVKKSMLKMAVDGVKALNIRGLNVTIPHKVEIINYLDKVDKLAENIGAVNTVVNEDGKLIGYNTDGPGAIKALQDKGFYLRGKRILILGAGGAARAIAYYIAREEPSEIIILNRSVEKALEVSDKIGCEMNISCKAAKLEEENLKKALENTDLLINCTSVGMFPNLEETLVPKAFLKMDMTVMDIVYNPIYTRLLREAADVGCNIICGIDMLVNQAALSFEIWTGIKAPVEEMRRTALEALRKDLL
ncbi:MAG: shikimate dehydrogenase [Nitrososphaeria archaeon]|nr:shikimate dehydrogenase [Nitrososphaeria archaeon]